ncbi:MAG: chorismate mutase [Spirochaetales bacterium]|nr:chorismate mutase [Spirochaetales bacterium]
MEMSLNEIAAVLEGLEETIIHRLIDRGQYCENNPVYEPGMSGFSGGGDTSLLDIRLTRQEEMDSEFGRFTVPEERPFCGTLPGVKRQVHSDGYPLNIEDFNCINLTAEIKTAYLSLLPHICREGDDGQYGSAVELDVAALQSISRRIHFGAFYVAESKFRADSSRYRDLIAKEDRAGLEALLTRRDVEEQILIRLKTKVNTIQSHINTLVRRRVSPEAIMQFYRDVIIPLTKKGEVEYLLLRVMDKDD